MYHTSIPANNVIQDLNHAWKIYCRNLKRAMSYGVEDLGHEIIGAGRDRSHQHLRHGEFSAVRDASFQLRRGECLVMLGANGTGKSTTLRMIDEPVKPDSGNITIRSQIGALLELETGFKPVLSRRGNIQINASVQGMRKQGIGRVSSVGAVELGDGTGQPQSEFETGETIRLRIGRKPKSTIQHAWRVVALCSHVRGMICSVSTPYFGFEFEVDVSGNTVTLQLPSVPLLIGAYHFNLPLYGPEPTDLCHRSSLRSLFRIVGPPTDGYGPDGINRIQHSWSSNG